MKPIVITSGDPAGIGPDILLDALQHQFSVPIVVLGDKDIFQQRAQQLQRDFTFANNVVFEPITCGDNCAPYVFSQLTTAATGCLQGDYSAMVTAPVNKEKLNRYQPFSGHTEWLANFCGVNKTVMCLSNTKLAVTLATTHLALRDVANAITATELTTTIKIISNAFPHKNILVCGLNPHASDNGLLGNEEKTIITPVVKQLKNEGHNIIGPLSADTVFLQALNNKECIVLAMYHDQGLSVVKTLDFENTINTTLGLPFIRTSVDHGTAYDLVGTGKASSGSLRAAILHAIQLADHHAHH